MRKNYTKRSKKSPQNDSLDGHVVVVEWEDAWKDGGAITTKEAALTESPFMVKSVGFFVARDEKGITFADSFHPDGRFRGPFFIPAGMIRKVEVI